MHGVIDRLRSVICLHLIMLARMLPITGNAWCSIRQTVWPASHYADLNVAYDRVCTAFNQTH